ncbi:MAG: diacylglycerol kinase family protein [Clostridia bacterium]|nr:diacylglycerol kinase family protein [Clostridia bacterium]
MKCYILYNPLAGNNHGADVLDNVRAHCSEFDCETIDMTSLDGYSDLFGKIGEGDRLVVCGGDGTLNRFVNDTDGLELPEELYYAPAGSGNDFANDIGLTKKEVLRKIKKYLVGLPTVFVNGISKKFINGIGYGIDGYCCEVGDELRKTTTKPINYTPIALKGLLYDFKPVKAEVTVDGESGTYEKTWLAPTMKGRFFGGGMMPTPNQDRLDPEGKLGVLIWHNSGKLRTLTAFPRIFKGTHVKFANGGKKICRMFSGHHVKVTFDRACALQIDGETVLNVKTYEAFSKLPELVKEAEEALV